MNFLFLTQLILTTGYLLAILLLIIGILRIRPGISTGQPLVVRFAVKPTSSIRIPGRSIDLEGKPITIEASGLMARALQHEIDHLNGTTVLDHASALKRSLYHRRLRKKARSDR